MAVEIQKREDEEAAARDAEVKARFEEMKSRPEPVAFQSLSEQSKAEQAKVETPITGTGNSTSSSGAFAGIALIIIIVIAVVSCSNLGSSHKPNDKKCDICGKPSTYELYDEEYCDIHVGDAINHYLK